MKRLTAACVALGFLAIVLAGAAPAPTSKAVAKGDERLTKTVDFPGIDDNKATLLDALDQLRTIYGVNFDVNEAAFKADGIDDVLSQPVAEKPIPKMMRASLEAVLRKVLARVNSSSGTGFLLRRNVIEITTGRAMQTEVWGPDFKGPFLPLVNMTLENCPLSEALKEMADLTDTSILLDPRVAEQARQTVTLRLRNVPLDSAVRLLANTAELGMYMVDNVVYVTSAENAGDLSSRDEPPHPMPGPWLGGGALPNDPETRPAPRIGSRPLARSEGLAIQ